MPTITYNDTHLRHPGALQASAHTRVPFGWANAAADSVSEWVWLLLLLQSLTSATQGKPCSLFLTLVPPRECIVIRRMHVSLIFR